ncbi:MAG: TadE family protein [Actinomycetota bacterium]
MTHRTTVTKCPSGRGQSTVEFALVVPVLLLFMAMGVQAAVAVLTKLAVTHTAREVSRALVVDPELDVQSFAESARPFGAGPLSVSVTHTATESGTGALIRVTVSDEMEGFLPKWIIDPTIATTVTSLGN